jgi:hypothetical protein
LCGLTSPATSRAKLTKDQRFGLLAEVPFQDILSLVQECDLRHNRLAPRASKAAEVS